MSSSPTDERRVERLLCWLHDQLMDGHGAARVVLVVNRPDGLIIEADSRRGAPAAIRRTLERSTCEAYLDRICCSAPLHAADDDLLISTVEHVARTGESRVSAVSARLATGVPVHSQGEVVAVVYVEGEQGDPPSQERLRWAQQVCDQARLPLHNALLLDRIEELEATLEGRQAAEVRPSMPMHHQEFLRRIDAIVAIRLADPSFTVEDLATCLGTSHRQLQRRLTELVGVGPGAYLRAARLDAARRALKRGATSTVAEVAWSVGMTPAYFARAYKAWAGVSPSKDRCRRS